ncbi:MAG: TonB-dependent receptor, partial [Saprospiraceae bacterium]|nr:TonB-dependent receptor [Saprospiraceae bacterium]
VRGGVILCRLPFFLSAQKTDSIALQTVVIQATRADASSPVPHTNLSAAAIAKMYQAQDIPFLLTGVPSLVETSDAGGGVGYTGLRIRGSDPTRVNVTINGVPLSDAESQIMYWVNLPDLAASATEIQVQRGVGTSTNGAGAFGATVNVDLSRVEAAPFATITNTVGSFGTRKHSAYLGTGLLAGKLAFTGRISTIHSDGYIERARVDLNSFHLTGTYLDDRQSLQAHLLSGHEITYQAWEGVPAQYIAEEQLRRFNTAGAEQPGTPYADQVDDYTQRHLLLHYKRILSPQLSLQLNGHYTRGFGFYEQYKADQDAADYGIPDMSLLSTDLVRRRWLDNHFYGGTFALRWTPKISWQPTVVLGGAVSRYAGKHFGEIIWSEYNINRPKDFRYYDNDADKRDANIFLKTEARMGQGLTALIDLQIRNVQYDFLGFDNEQRAVDQSAGLFFFNPKVGLNWQFAPRWSTYGFFGVAHREPNRDDYTQSTPRSRPRAERLFDVETGLKTTRKQWNATANFYWMQYRDQLVLDGRLNDVGASIRTNVPNSFRAGLELEAAVQLHPRWQLTANAAFSENKVQTFTEYRDNWDTGEQATIVYQNTDLAYSPKVITRGELNWTMVQRSRHLLAISWSGKYVGQQFLDNTSNPNTALSGYFFSDVRLNYHLKKVIGEELSLLFAINNIFNKKYSSNGWTYRYTSQGYDARPDNPYARAEGNSVYNLTGFFPQAGRNWMGTVVVRF